MNEELTVDQIKELIKLRIEFCKSQQRLYVGKPKNDKESHFRFVMYSGEIRSLETLLDSIKCGSMEYWRVA